MARSAGCARSWDALQRRPRHGIDQLAGPREERVARFVKAAPDEEEAVAAIELHQLAHPFDPDAPSGGGTRLTYPWVRLPEHLSDGMARGGIVAETTAC